jgi:hypothetical protein
VKWPGTFGRHPVHYVVRAVKKSRSIVSEREIRFQKMEKEVGAGKSGKASPEFQTNLVGCEQGCQMAYFSNQKS